MGGIKKRSKGYSTPSHPWTRNRIENEKKLISGYGLKNKKELWKAEAQLEKFRNRARDLIGGIEEESEEKKELIDKLSDLGIVNKGADLEDILALDVESFLDRTLQTLVYKKGIGNSQKQARQLILHGHVELNGRRHTSPRTLVSVKEEKTINYTGPSLEKKEKKKGKKQAEKSGKKEKKKGKKEKKKTKEKKKSGNKSDKKSKKDKKEEKEGKKSEK